MDALTIRCRLVAGEEARHRLWTLMAEANTPLITRLIDLINGHGDVEAWQRRGRLPAGLVHAWCQDLRMGPPYTGQPAQFYLSAAHTVEQMYASWFALHDRARRARDGHRRWLGMLRSDTQLALDAGLALDALRREAASVLARASRETGIGADGVRGSERSRLYRHLMAAYDSAPVASRCAIALVLKGGLTVPDTEEDLDRLARRCRAVEIRIERLTERLVGRRPVGRTLTDDAYLRALTAMIEALPADEVEARFWQDALLRAPDPLPFPLHQRDNGAMRWSRDASGRIRVRISGLAGDRFAVYGDRRQMHWFGRFVEDQRIQREGRHSSALFTLRSAHLAWQVRAAAAVDRMGDRGDNPWERYGLTLFCTVDARLWTREGTEAVRREKAVAVGATLTRLREKGDLSEAQRGYERRLTSTLERLDGYEGRPGAHSSGGNPDIVLGVGMGRDVPVMVAVVEARQATILASYTAHQLLGDDGHLLARRRREQVREGHRHHVATRRGVALLSGESQLGLHVDRLLARAIVAVARRHRAGALALPLLGDVREAAEAEVRVRAERKRPGYKEGQREYAKQYRASVHRWPVGQLVASLRAAATRQGIPVEEGRQPLGGAPRERTRDVALDAYRSRRSAAAPQGDEGE